MGVCCLGLRLAQAGVEGGGHAGEPELAERVIEFDEIHVRVSCLLIDEVAIERELANERVDLLERERRGGPPFEIAAEKAIGRDLELERRFGGVVGRRRPVLLGEREDAEDAAHAGGALVVVDVGADRVEMRAGVARPREERERVDAGVRAGRSASAMR